MNVNRIDNAPKTNLSTAEHEAARRHMAKTAMEMAGTRKVSLNEAVSIVNSYPALFNKRGGWDRDTAVYDDPPKKAAGKLLRLVGK